MLDNNGNMVFTRPVEPDGDPVPWLTDLWRSNGCFAADLPTALANLKGVVGSQGAAHTAFSPEAQSLTAVLGSVKNAISALHQDVVTYRVAFSDKEGVPAGTDTLGKSVIVGTKALSDPRLTEGQRAAILVGLAFHETGHIDQSQAFRRRTEVAFMNSANLRLALKLHNVGDDNRIERLKVVEYPSMKVALDAAAWFVSQLQTEIWAAKGIADPFTPDFTSAEGRTKVLCMATRYPFTIDWSMVNDEQRAFMLAWADKMSADHTPDEHIVFISEAIDWIGDLPEEEEEETESTEGGDESDEDDESTEGESDSEPKGSEAGESNDDDADDDTEGDDGDAEGDDEDGDGGSDSEDTDDGEAGEGGGEESEADGDDDGEDGDSNSTEGESESNGSGTDAEGDSEDDDSDAEGEAGDGEAEGEGAPGDTKGDTDGGPNVTDDDSDDTEGGDEVGGDTPSKEGDAGDLNAKSEVPDLDEECGNDLSKDKSLDDVAQEVTSAHERGQRDVGRMRRYPGATGGTMIVRERRLTFDAFAMGETLTEGDSDAVDVARNTDELDTTTWHDEDLTPTKDNPAAASALAEVITSARRGPGMAERGQRSGRIDRRSLSRVATGDPKVFVKNTAPAPQRVRVHMLLDASSSMTEVVDRNSDDQVSRLRAAGQVARDLAGAFDRLPWAACRMYAHTEDSYGPFVAHIWATGEPRKNVDRYFKVPNHGTPDGYAIAFACDDLLDELRPSEKGVLIIVSDGAPSYNAGQHHVANVVAYYRQRGIRVVSVSLSKGLTADQQRVMYGKDVVPYDSNVNIFARNMAKVVGSSL